MTQKPMLRAKVYAHAMRASQNRKEEVLSLTSESGGRATHTVIELTKKGGIERRLFRLFLAKRRKSFPPFRLWIMPPCHTQNTIVI